MSLPRKLKNMNLFNEGESYLGQIKTVVLPKLTRKMEDYRGGGMNAPLKIDMGMGDDGLVLESTFGGLDLLTLRQFGLEKVDGVYMRFAGLINVMTQAKSMQWKSWFVVVMKKLMAVTLNQVKTLNTKS